MRRDAVSRLNAVRHTPVIGDERSLLNNDGGFLESARGARCATRSPPPEVDVDEAGGNSQVRAPPPAPTQTNEGQTLRTAARNGFDSGHTDADLNGGGD